MKLWSAHDLARELGFPGDCPAFRRWCRKRGLEPLPGRPFSFDLDAAEAARRAA